MGRKIWCVLFGGFKANERSKLVLQTSIGLVVAVSHDVDSVEYGT